MEFLPVESSFIAETILLYNSNPGDIKIVHHQDFVQIINTIPAMIFDSKL